MTWAQSIVLGAVQGLTEFLPISSSGHLRIVSEIWFGEDAGASFTAVTQLGTEAAVLVFFAKDIVRIIAAWFRGLFNKEARDLDYRMGWYVIIATIPIGVLGLAVQGRDPYRRTQPLVGGEHAHRLLRGDRRGREDGPQRTSHRKTHHP